MPRTMWTGTRCCCTTSPMTQRQQACRRSGVRCLHFPDPPVCTAAGRSSLASAPLLYQSSSSSNIASAHWSWQEACAAPVNMQVAN